LNASDFVITAQLDGVSGKARDRASKYQHESIEEWLELDTAKDMSGARAKNGKKRVTIKSLKTFSEE